MGTCFENRIEDNQQFAHGGDQCGLARLSDLQQALIENLKDPVVLNCDHSRQFQDGAHLPRPPHTMCPGYTRPAP